MEVFLIDDDEEISKHYRKALEYRGAFVVFSSSVDDALRVSASKKHDFDVVVIDIMMAWGPYKQADTEGGLRTGLLLYWDLRKQFEKATFVILTNLDEQLVPREFKEAKVRVCPKGRFSPIRLAGLILKLAHV